MKREREGRGRTREERERNREKERGEKERDKVRARPQTGEQIEKRRKSTEADWRSLKQKIREKYICY